MLRHEEHFSADKVTGSRHSFGDARKNKGCCIQTHAPVSPAEAMHARMQYASI